MLLAEKRVILVVFLPLQAQFPFASYVPIFEVFQECTKSKHSHTEDHHQADKIYPFLAAFSQLDNESTASFCPFAHLDRLYPEYKRIFHSILHQSKHPNLQSSNRNGNDKYLSPPHQPKLEYVIVPSTLYNLVTCVILYVVMFVCLEQVFSCHCITFI